MTHHYLFNGSNNYVTFPAPASYLPQGDASRSVSFHIKPDNRWTDHWIFVYGNVANNEMFGVTFLVSTGGQKISIFGFNHDIHGGITLNNGTEYHVVATYDSATGVIKTYINGTLDIDTTTTNYNTGSGEFRLGNVSFEATYYYPGELSDVKVFNRAITPAEVATLGARGNVSSGKVFEAFCNEVYGDCIDIINANDGTTHGTLTNFYNPVAPSWASTYPKTGGIEHTIIELLAQIEQPGSGYLVCLSSAASAPSAAQVKAGQDANGDLLADNFRASTALIAATEGNFFTSKLTPGETYDIYLIAEATLLQSSPTLVTADALATGPTIPTEAEYLQRGKLSTKTIVNFRLNNGDSLGDTQDVTKLVTNMAQLTEKLSKSSVDVGGVILPKLSVRLDNTRGLWDIGGDYFGPGFVEKSLIEIETYNQIYTQHGAFSSAFSRAFDSGPGWRKISPSFKYRGLISTVNSVWDVKSKKLKLSLVDPSSLFATEKIEPGITSTGTFAHIIYQILNRNPFTRYMTVSAGNINPGYDLADVVDDVSELANKKVKDILDRIAYLSGSVYYINYDNEFIFESIYDASPSAVWNLTGNDFDVETLAYDWQGQYTAFKWDDGESTIIRSEMGYTDREEYQYRFREKKIDDKFVVLAVNRQLITDNLLLWHKHLKRWVALTSKWNPEAVINKYITLDVPKEAIAGDKYFVWNKSSWNAGKIWGLPSPGISFDSSIYWRVYAIKRDPLGAKMTIKCKIAGIGPDDNV